MLNSLTFAALCNHFHNVVLRDILIDQLTDGAAVSHDDNAVTVSLQLGDFGGDHQNGDAAVGQLLDQHFDFSLVN